MDALTTLVVLPGLDGTDVFFRPFLAALPPSIHPIVVNFPSHGANGYDALLELVRRSVAATTSFYVLGSSFSGPLAIMLAEAEPTKVRGMILSATFIRSPRRRLARFRFAAVPPIIWLVRVTRRIPVWLSRNPQDPLRRAKAETWSRVPAHVLAARVRAVLGVDVRRILQSCVQPLLCIRYQDDGVVPHENAEEILQHHASAELVTLPGRHLAMYEDPQRLAEEVVRFLRRAESERL